jgi:hypothetical protein
LGCFDCTGRLCQGLFTGVYETGPLIFPDEETRLPLALPLDFRLPE